MSFIDDFSRMTWIYFLKKKLEVFKRFLELKYLVENQIDKKIKVPRTDNGGESCGKEFNQFYKQHGIARQNITPYMPQHNGAAERMRRTLMEKARSMLNYVDLSLYYLEEVVDTTCYVVNKSSTLDLVHKTPYESWDSKRHSLAHLRVFGCDAFVHIKKNEDKDSTIHWRSVSLLDTSHGIQLPGLQCTI